MRYFIGCDHLPDSEGGLGAASGGMLALWVGGEVTSVTGSGVVVSSGMRLDGQ